MNEQYVECLEKFLDDGIKPELMTKARSLLGELKNLMFYENSEDFDYDLKNYQKAKRSLYEKINTFLILNEGGKQNE